jgi:SAM-dependent methyltransferase
VSNLGRIFDEIYRANTWEGVESRSGKGAGDIERAHLAPDVARLVADLGVESVLDVGCGETYWTPDLPGYVGIDVSSEAIQVARKRHPDWDLRIDDGSPFPPADLVMSRCVFQHLSFDTARALMARIRATGATWFLCTSYHHGWNQDIVDGAGYWPDMRLSPFDLGEPDSEIEDGRTDHVFYDCVLGLWRLKP